jgi:TolB protein
MKSIAFILLFTVSPLFAQDVYLKLTTGQRKKIRIALCVDSDKFKPLAGKMRKIVKDDLTFSLYFNDVVDTVSSSKKIDFPLWASEEVSAFVKVNIRRARKDTVVTVEVYDVFSRHKISSDKQKLRKATFRGVCHRISDHVVKSLTGENGVSQTRIVLSVRKGQDKNLAIVDYDGFGVKTIKKGEGLYLSPKWVPNRDAITYVTYKEEEMWLYKFDLFANKLYVLSKERGMNMGSCWSPNGKELAITLTKAGNAEVYLKTGRKLKRLTVNRFIDTSPTWSPNGREIAFVSDRSGSPQVYIMGRDGTNVRRLTFEGRYNTSPAWSPKGDRVAYVSREVDGSFQIHTILVDGEGDTYLTWEGDNENPSWSPDGLHLCFVSRTGGRPELFTMHWDGSGRKKAASLGDGCFTPSWSSR